MVPLLEREVVDGSSWWQSEFYRQNLKILDPHRSAAVASDTAGPSRHPTLLHGYVATCAYRCGAAVLLSQLRSTLPRRRISKAPTLPTYHLLPTCTMPTLWDPKKAAESRDRWSAYREARAQRDAESTASASTPRSPSGQAPSSRSPPTSGTLAIHRYHRTVATPLTTVRGAGGGDFELNGQLAAPRPSSTWSRIPDAPTTSRTAALEGQERGWSSTVVVRGRPGHKVF